MLAFDISGSSTSAHMRGAFLTLNHFFSLFLKLLAERTKPYVPHTASVYR
ncbi:hypothetical protein NTGBS_400004 [Candidatus Nitrotoga sp. BS]|nr:hypothetical protein NTGBS_400004 [Candidatus Nitrotoga sp. BS]